VWPAQRLVTLLLPGWLPPFLFSGFSCLDNSILNMLNNVHIYFQLFLLLEPVQHQQFMAKTPPKPTKYV
jgi:hypothetical protein